MKTITYKQSEDRTIHETVDLFLEHLEREKAEQKRVQMQCLFGSMLDELILASVKDQGNWGPGIDLKKFGGSITLSPSSVRLGPITQPHVDALIEGTLPFVASAFTSPTKDEITFNGSPMKDVISYDETTGEVHYYEIDWHSKNYITDSDDPTGYRTAKSKGQVQVQTKYKAPAPSAATTDLNKQPYDGCGIDPNYAPWGNAGNNSYPNSCMSWYRHGIPNVCEAANNVEFDYVVFGDVIDHDGQPILQKTYRVAQLNNLRVEGISLGSMWTLIKIEEQGADLLLCFAHLCCNLQSQIQVTPKIHIDSLALRHVAYEAGGYPHIYKIVRVPGASFTLHTPNALPPADVLDPKTWMPGSRVEIRNNPHYAAPDTGTITTMKRLC